MVLREFGLKFKNLGKSFLAFSLKKEAQIIFCVVGGTNHKPSRDWVVKRPLAENHLAD